MQAILTFPLLGRPSYVRRKQGRFLDSLHCYWGKFLFACATFLAAPEENLREVDHRYTFIGPAPRFFYSALGGDRGSRDFHRKCLRDLRTARDWVAEECGAQHALYNIQLATGNVILFALAVGSQTQVFHCCHLQRRSS